MDGIVFMPRQKQGRFTHLTISIAFSREKKQGKKTGLR